MKSIWRHLYLDRLKRYLTSPSAIALSGMRRVGKSVLMRQLKDDLEQTEKVVYIDKESLDFDGLRTAKDVIDYVDSASTVGARGEMRYVLIDEVQLIDEWERAVASLNGRDDTRVIISGSNAHLLSGELATRIAGRYLVLPVFPLSLQEFSELHSLLHPPLEDKRELFKLYLRTGGLPGLLHTDLSEELRSQMQRDIFHSIAMRDIIGRHAIRDVRLFEAVMAFIMDTVGSPVSAKKIADFLKKERRSISVDSVLNYLSYMREGYLLYEVPRYDLKGKRLLEVNHKYYLGDIGLRNGLLGYREADISGLLENLVFLELLRRGFTVRVGRMYDYEIDFVAEKERERHYLQVSYLIETPDTLERELRPLRAVDDQWPKTLLSLDEFRPRVFEGIRHHSIIDFLMGAGI